MNRVQRATLTLRVAQGAAAIAVLALVWSASGGGAPAAGEMPRPMSQAGAAQSADTGNAAVDVARLIARDPFSPMREAPAVAYRIAPTDAPVRAAVPVRPVRLLGTVIQTGTRSFAMVQVGDDPPKVVYPGDRIGGLRLERVMQGSAGFIDDAGQEVVLHVPRSGG